MVIKLIVGDYGKSTHCMNFIIAAMWKFLGHALVIYISINPKPWLILVLNFVFSLRAALQVPMAAVSEI